MTFFIQQKPEQKHCLSNTNQRFPLHSNEYGNAEIFRSHGTNYPNNRILVNPFETETDFHLEIALPGWSKTEIKISVEEKILKLESIENHAENEKLYRLKEFGKTRFSKVFRLPEEADLNKVSAEMHSGVLKIIIAKKFAKQTQKIEIN